MHPGESWQNVGKSIRCLRKANGLTLKQLAKGSGLSANAISLVERGEVAPTVQTLCRIANALGVPASSFFDEICPSEAALAQKDYLYSDKAGSILSSLTCRLITPGLDPDAKIGEKDPHTTPAQDQTILCLSGQIGYESHFKECQLQPGEILSFNGSSLHRFNNPGGETSIAIIIIPAAQKTQ